MEMDVFAGKVRAAVEREMGSGYEVSLKNVRKNNNVHRKGLVIQRRGEDVSPIIYLELFGEAYEAGSPITTVAKMIQQFYRKGKVEGSVDVGFFRDFKAVKDRICYRLINRAENRSLLEDIPYIEFLDLAVCFYYAYDSSELGDVSILIYNSHVEMWGTCIADLLELAKKNTPRLFPWKYAGLGEILDGNTRLAQEGQHGGESLDGLEGEPFGYIPMKVLTNSKKSYGAISILYPGVLKEIAKMAGTDFYIIPSSVHEVLTLPYDGLLSEGAVKAMISEINDTQVAPEEVLSNSLYRYIAEENDVVLV